MKRGLTLVAMAFGLGLAVVIGTRMSTDAVALVVGVVCGVLASIPTSLLLVWALGRRNQGAVVESQARHGLGAAYPPVVVVNPGPSYGLAGYGPPSSGLLERGLPAPTGPRSFKVVGDEETKLDNVQRVFPGLDDVWRDAN